jgi:hypothetical protein
MQLKSSTIEILKLAAMLAMFIDHFNRVVGMGPYGQFMVIFGRIAFPSFALILIYNYLYNSKNRKMYVIRLFVLALISQPLYSLTISYYELNTVFALLLALLTINLIIKRNNNPIWYFILTLVALFVDYGIAGLAFMVTLYLYLKDRKWYFIPLMLLTCFAVARFHLPYFIIICTIPFFIFVLELVKISNFRLNKYIYYSFYPGHLLLLYLLKM